MSIHKFSWKDKPDNAEGKPRAALVRYGAFGDIAQAIGICRALKEQGYHVTLFCTYPSSEIVAFDPYVDRMVVQNQDQIPISQLGYFWQWMETRWMGKGFQKWVNLTESIESNLLAMPGNIRFWYPPKLRERLMNFNYIEHQYAIAGLQWDKKYAFKFYASEDDKKWWATERARMERAGIKKFILWGLAGSSRTHKIIPHMHPLWLHVLKHYPEWGIVTVGDGSCVEFEKGFEGEQRVWKTSGKWHMRNVCTAMEHADVVMGPETGIMSCAAYYPMPKIVVLSHSTVENLSKDWVNTSSVWSPNTTCVGRGKNEALACHKMLPSFEGCTKGPLGVAQCASDVKAEWLWDLLQYAMNNGKAKKWLPPA